MKEVLRNTLAAMAGAITGIMLLSAIRTLSLRNYPLPAGVGPENREATLAWFKTLPTEAFLLILLSYLVGVCAGAHVAGRFSSDGGSRQAKMVTGLFVVASFISLFSLPYPVWFWFANIAVVVAAGWLAVKLLPKRVAS